MTNLECETKNSSNCEKIKSMQKKSQYSEKSTQGHTHRV